MPRNWNSMTQEEKDAYNLLRRQKYAELTPEAKLAINAKKLEHWNTVQKPKRQASWNDLTEQEAINRFFYGYQKWYERIIREVHAHPPVFGEDDKTRKGRDKVLTWNFEREKKHAWDTWLQTTRRFNRPNRNSVDTAGEAAARRWVRNVCKWLEIYAHWAKFGGHRPGPNTVKEFRKVELWHKILLTLGRTCSICRKPLIFDYACRPVLRSDPMYVVPNTVWALADMWDHVQEYEIICFKCHFDMRIEMTLWLWTPDCPRFAAANRLPVRIPLPKPELAAEVLRWREIYPSDTEELRRRKPKWIVTAEQRDGKKYEPFFLRRTDSHVYWRGMPRTMTPVHETQSIYFYQQLFPSVNTNSWGLGRCSDHITTIKCEAMLSKDLRDFYRKNPPPGHSPLSEDECEKIYEKSFNGLIQKGILWY